MKYPIASWLKPINIFEIEGSMCCLNLYMSYLKNNLTKQFNCYNAPSLFEANTLVIWGGISAKLADNLSIYFSYLPKPNFTIHIQGCHPPMNARESVFDSVLDRCNPSLQDMRQVIWEARRCLIA